MVRGPEHFTAGERENSWRHVKCSWLCEKTLSEPTNRRSIHHSLHQCNWSRYIFGHRTNKDATFTKATEETCWPSWALRSIHRSGVLPCTVLPSPWHCNNTADKAVWTGRATAPGQAGESPTLWSSWWRGWPVSRAAVPVPKGGAGHVHCQLHLQNLLRSDRNHEEHGSRGPWSLQSSWGTSAFVARCSCLICWSRENFSALRRLKTWLRSSMSQTRLNSVAICHVHRERVYNLDKKKLCQEFVQVTDRRMHVFGSF